MVYRSIGIMSGSSLDGLDMVFTELEERAGKWAFEIRAAECTVYTAEWKSRLQNAPTLSAYDYMLLHAAYGRYIGESVNAFIEKHHLFHQVQIIGSHGHTVFHAPQYHMTAQVGDGAAIAAVTGINVVSDLRNMDVALGGQGAPIVPTGEKLLFGQYDYCLNIGGIANISSGHSGNYVAFDVCPANRVLNMLAEKSGKAFDENGTIAKSGHVNIALLHLLNEQEYYRLPFPKSLANSFGTDIIFPLIEAAAIPPEDAMRTYAEHIAIQVAAAAQRLPSNNGAQMLVTGGGAFNSFLITLIQQMLTPLNITVTVPAEDIVQYKEALIMALLGVLRWREEDTVLKTVTGATRNSIGGAVWIGQEA